MDDASTTLDPNRALPNRFYRSASIHAVERSRIWHNDWVFVTSEDAVADPGDQLPTTIAEQPVLLLRNQEGDLGAVSNLCAHRGTLLVAEPTNAKRIQCPYHAWTYTDGGRLLSVPFTPKDAIDRDAHCLPTYRVEVWHGLVFVSMNPDVEPIAERFAAVDELLTDRGIDELHHWSETQDVEPWNCNWKLAALNAMESYHLFQVHPETLEPYTPTRDAYYIAGSARSTATGGASRGDDDYLLLSLPPGFVGVMSTGSFIWQAVHPTSPTTCVIRTGGAFTSPPPSRAAGGKLGSWITKTASAAAAAAVPDFLPEDRAICERGQLGAAGDFEPGHLVPMERVVADFHRYLDWRLNGVEPAPIHREPNR